LHDDGKGLDFDKIRVRAEQMHLIKKGDTSIDNNHLLQAIFAPGFSTAEQAGMHAGRGMGLSLVRERIKEANGLIKVQTEKGKGTVFTILLPILPPPQSPL
jgi:chemotaxis protein histidine kinase CheA